VGGVGSGGNAGEGGEDGLGFVPCDAYAACVLEDDKACVRSCRRLFAGVELGLLNPKPETRNPKPEN
jgi:hypothetical protein